MKKIAKYLRTQAAALTAMADADNLKGKYADELAENARGLGRKLDLAEDRYREVKGHLTNWSDDLEDLQKKADKALRDAQDAQHIVDSRTNKHNDRSPSDKKKNEEGASDPEEDPVLKQAKEDLENARKRLNTAEGDYRERANHFAGKIRSSIDDDMKDSLWNDIKAWVADADWLDDLAEAASWAATVVGLVALIFPAVGIVALALTVTVTLIHLAQAATGSGSWVDVFLDCASLKLAQIGMKAGKAVRALQQDSRKTAAGLAESRAAGRAAETNAGARKTAARKSRKRGGTSRGQRDRARARLLQMQAKNRDAGKRASNEVTEAEMPQVTWKERFKAIGDAAVAKQQKDIKKWRDTHPENATLVDNARKARRNVLVLRTTWLTSTTADFTDKGADLLGHRGYSRLKDHTEAPVVGTSQW